MSALSRLHYAIGLAVIALGVGLGLWAAFGKISSTGPDSPQLRRSDQLVTTTTSTTLASSAGHAPAGSPSYQYNARGQVTLILYPDNTSYSYSYDSHGDKTRETDASGKTWLYIYDEHQHPVTVIDPQGHLTQIAVKPGEP